MRRGHSALDFGPNSCALMDSASRPFLPLLRLTFPLPGEREQRVQRHAMTDNLIALVEDNEDDVFFMRRALKGAGITSPVRVLTDGQQAVDYLAGNAPTSGDALPVIVFLDLKLPYCTGFEVLEEMRKTGTLERTQVVILTSSPEERDRKRARELGATAYLVKPPTPAMLKELFSNIPKRTASAT